MTGYEVQQSTTAYPLIFILISSTDHISGLTGQTPTVTISKNGGSFAAPSGAVTEIGSGWYKVAGNATDTATLGPVILHATNTGADPTDIIYPVVAVNPQSTAYGLSLAKSTNLTGFNDIAATAIVSSGAITTSGGAVSTVSTVTNTVSANVTQVLGTASAGAAGYVGIDWGHVTNPTTTVGLTGTTISTGQAVASVSGAVGSVTGAVGSVSGSVASVTGNVGGSVASVTGNVGGNVVGSTASVSGAVGSVTGNVGGSVASVTAAVTISLTQTLGAGRALDSIADTSLTLNDALMCAVSAYAGAWAVVGTAWTMKTPHTGTVLRTFTLDSGTAPTLRS